MYQLINLKHFFFFNKAVWCLNENIKKKIYLLLHLAFEYMDFGLRSPLGQLTSNALKMQAQINV